MKRASTAYLEATLTDNTNYNVLTDYTIVPRGVEPTAIRALRTMELDANALMRKSMRDVLEQTVRVLTTYPPERNNAPPAYGEDRWWGYERGEGAYYMGADWQPVYNKKRRSKYLTSPDMWHTEVHEERDGSIGMLYTDIWYAPFVFGSRTQEQVWFHSGRWLAMDELFEELRSGTAAKRGIKTLQELLVEVADELIDRIQEGI